MFHEIAADSHSSATVLTGRAARIFAGIVRDSRAEDPGTFWEELLSTSAQLVSAKREMAPIINLANDVLASVESGVLSGAAAESLKQKAASVLDEAAEFAEDDLDRVARHGIALVPQSGLVATTSSSECVRAVLLAAHGAGVEFRVVLSESRPAMEGVAMAKALGAEGIPTTLVVDAALPALAAESQTVLVGADSVSQTSFVNKVGTLSLAVAAREGGVPLYVAAQESKLLAQALLCDAGRLHAASEVLERPPAGVEVENRYFEIVPLSLASGVVTETGVLSAEEVQEAIAERPIAPGLLGVLFPKRAPLSTN